MARIANSGGDDYGGGYGSSYGGGGMPLFWIRRQPVYVTGIICALVVVGMIASVIVESAGINLAWFEFYAPVFLRGALWQIFTYPWVSEANFFFLFSVLFFFFAGNEVEKYLGRKRYFILLGMLWLCGPVISCLWQSVGFGSALAGITLFTAALFIAFATLYPNMEYWGWIPLKWFAFACLFLSSLSYLPRHNWHGLVVLWTMCGLSFGYIRFLQNRLYLPPVLAGLAGLFKRKPKFKVVPREASQRDVVHESIDPILDKISKHGLSSLTTKEREQLERMSKKL